MTETIYVALLDQGAAVWRPVQAARRAGSLVRCVERKLADGSRLVAVELVPTTALKIHPAAPDHVK